MLSLKSAWAGVDSDIPSIADNRIVVICFFVSAICSLNSGVDSKVVVISSFI